MSVKKVFRLFVPPIFSLVNTRVKNNFYMYISRIISKKIEIKTLLNESVYVLGNSPSLKELDLELMYGKNVFVCNRFYLHPMFENLKKQSKITYFTLDPIESHVKMAENSSTTLVLGVKKYYDNFISKDYQTIVHKSVFDFFKKHMLYTDYNVTFFNQNSLERYFKSNLVSSNACDLKRALSVRHTPNAMITIALLNGFNTIYLLGLQHSYVRDKINKLSHSGHFYKDFQESIQELDLAELFFDSYQTFSVYKEQDCLARLLGIKIYDCTSNGLLDMFEKQKLSNDVNIDRENFSEEKHLSLN